MFWDSSALVPLLLVEPRSDEVTTLMNSDQGPAICWGSKVECWSAIYRRHRESPFTQDDLARALMRLDFLVEEVDAITATESVRKEAKRLLSIHDLRAADALQLASALVWRHSKPTQKVFVCFDNRLRDAARLEGFSLWPE